MIVTCIVDYTNFYPHRNAGHRQLLEHEFMRMVEDAAQAVPDLERLDIRIYGGWLENGVLSKEASELQQILGEIELFPLRHPSGRGLLHGSVSLALRLDALPNVAWQYTLKRVRGLGRLRVENSELSDLCRDNREQCPILCLRRFTRAKGKICGVAGCVVSNSDAFVRHQQKMVDTMMVCDALSLAERADMKGIFVFTDDLDLLPGLAILSARYAKHIQIVFRNHRLERDFSPLLRDMKITHSTWAGD